MIYFIQCAENGAIKIGKADDPEQRIKQLQTGSAYRLVLIGAIPGNEATESAIHNLFTEERMNGEWFSPSERLVEFVNSIVKSVNPLLDFQEFVDKIKRSKRHVPLPNPDEAEINGFIWCSDSCPNHGNFTEEGYEGIGKSGYRFAPRDDYPDLYWNANPDRDFFFCNMCDGVFTIKV